MIVYRLPPIDHWSGWARPSTVLATHPDDCDSIQPEEYAERLATAKRLALKVRWEGDMREGPFIAGLPNMPATYCPCYMIAWKQDNNGETFIASPFPLPWLETGEYASIEWIDEEDTA